jgi:hypothetical protein
VSCTHERLSQISNVVAETFWIRQADGSYEPEPVGPICLTRIVEEQTESFTCEDCGEPISA